MAELRSTSLNIHRLLDEAFTGIAVTPDIQDLKEEMRGNLVARAAELEAAGEAPEEAARRALAEVGDVRAVIDEMAQSGAPAAPWHRHRVRPRPARETRRVRTTYAGLAALGALAALVAVRMA